MMGQLEFLAHIVENAPALRILNIDPRKKLGRCTCSLDFLAIQASVTSKLAGKILPGTEVNIL